MSLSNEIKNINVDYAFSYEDVLQYAAEMAGKREAELLDEISRLRAVIDELPDLFAVVQAVDDETGEHYEADLDSDPIDKSLLLAKHGVEAT